MNHKTTIFTAVLLAAGAIGASVTGCELIASVDRAQITGTGGTGGTTSSASTTSSTGTGGTTTSSTGTGGTTTSSSGTGGAMCGVGVTKCISATDCPAAPNECVTASCDGIGCCVTTDVLVNTLTTAGQTTGDCMKQICDGNGNLTMVADDTDLPDDANACTADSCNAGAPVHTPQAGACTLVGGAAGVCGDVAGTSKGTCIGCNTSADCTTGTNTHCSAANLCVSPQCTDGAMDGVETDVDCGGVDCGATCADTKKCNGNGDCLNAYCKANVCTAPTCTDGAKNGSETDIDCGGGSFKGNPACGACANTKACLLSTDCTSGFCDPTAHTCQAPTCTDGSKNGTETGIDCGGATCDALGKTCVAGQVCNNANDCTSAFCDGTNHCALKPNGTACGAGTECLSTSCTDGVCCNTACNGTCQACSAVRIGGGGVDGTCGSIAAGTDPKNQCSSTSQTTCGQDGSCNGAGACEMWSMATVCAGASCVGTVLHPTENCSGTGTCVVAATMDCAPYNCNVAGCPSTCALDTDCSAGNYCSSGACIPVKADGVACGKNTACTSGFCTDGVCCDTACAGTCQACGIAGKVGTCSNVTSGQTDTGTCAAPNVCNGSGSCVETLGTACATGTECLTGFCADGVCCDSTCLGVCQACNLVGTVGNCTLVPSTGTDNSPACNGINACDGSGVCRTAPGQPCVTGVECASQICTSSVCN